MLTEIYHNNIIACLTCKVPVIFISTTSSDNNIARSLHYRADEFLIEPVSTDTIAKIINDQIDSRPQIYKEHVLVIADLVLNRETLIVTWRDKKIPLYPRQVRLLEFLMLNPRRPIARIELLKNVWGTDARIKDGTIYRNIKRMRDLFKRQTKCDPIETIHRVGYLFNDQLEQSSSLPRGGRVRGRPILKHCVRWGVECEPDR